MSFITINLWSLLSVFFHWFDKSLSLWCLGIASVKVSLEVLGIGNLQKELKFISHKITSLARRSVRLARSKVLFRAESGIRVPVQYPGTRVEKTGPGYTDKAKFGLSLRIFYSKCYIL